MGREENAGLCCGPAPEYEQGNADEALALMSKALGHAARVRILKHLVERGTCVCGEIVDQFPLAQSTVSQHLKILKEAGLIHGEIEGTRVCYCVNHARLEQLKALVGALQRAA